MAESIVGTVGVKWGIGSSATGTGIGTFAAQSSTFTAESDKAEFRNSKGQVTTEVYYNQRQLFTLEVIPTGATVAAARSANILPAPGAIVTVADTEDTEVSGTNGGKYICVRASKQSSNTDAAKLTFELIQYVENDVAVLIS